MVQLKAISPVGSDELDEFNEWLEQNPKCKITAMTMTPGASRIGEGQISVLIIAYENG